jgi:hypothetical protein
MWTLSTSNFVLLQVTVAPLVEKTRSQLAELALKKQIKINSEAKQ